MSDEKKIWQPTHDFHGFKVRIVGNTMKAERKGLYYNPEDNRVEIWLDGVKWGHCYHQSSSAADWMKSMLSGDWEDHVKWKKKYLEENPPQDRQG